LNTARLFLAGAGTNTAALAFGGESVLANTETWNGTSWTAVNVLNIGRGQLAGCGTNTVALAFGGTGPSAATEEWTGSITQLAVKTITTS
jgi:hypothetical protein